MAGNEGFSSEFPYRLAFLRALVEQLIHPLEAQLHELTPMGSASLRIAADHIVEHLNGLFEIALLEDPLAGIGPIRFGTEELV